MTFKEFYKKEKHVVLHGQTTRFRMVKYIVLFAIGVGVYLWKGLATVSLLFLVLAIAGVVVHFFFRWKTDGWEKSWGSYKKIPLDLG